MTEEFFTALRAWHYTKCWGLANGDAGWANEDADYIDAITVLENEQNAIENEEMDKATEKSGGATGKIATPGKVANGM